MGSIKNILRHTDKGLIDVTKCLDSFWPIGKKPGFFIFFWVFEDILISFLGFQTFRNITLEEIATSFSDFLIFRNVTLDFTLIIQKPG